MVVVESSNALDRAKNMLSKYSNKRPEPVAKLQKSAGSFNEDDIIDSDELSGMDMSEDNFNQKISGAMVLCLLYDSAVN